MVTRKTNERVGLYINPHTRARLNKLKADLALEQGEILSQSQVIMLLIDHFETTAQTDSEPVRELA